MNKKDKEILESYRRSDKINLYQAYGRFSDAKAEAWEYCERLCKERSGWGLKVISYNRFFFTAGFLFEDDGAKLMYITHTDDRVIEYIFSEKALGII